MRIVREEIFGPVVAIIPFDDEAEAVRLANDTPYGLVGLDLDARHRPGAARRQGRQGRGAERSTRTQSVHTEAPFGGYKMSGVGRELGMHALELYTEVKNVFVDLT